jgi:hypothetical protein
MDLRDSDRLRLLEMLAPSLGLPDVRQLAERLVESIVDEQLREYGKAILGRFLVDAGERNADDNISYCLPMRVLICSPGVRKMRLQRTRNQPHSDTSSRQTK